jgi:acetyl esterase/lipase
VKALDVVKRLDPALRHLGDSRTNLSPEVLAGYRESLNKRRRAEAHALDTTGVSVEDTHAGAVPVRTYRGSPPPAPAVVYASAVSLMWRHYLAERPPSDDAIPARAIELAGVPATLITCSDVDPLRDEAIDYARRLMSAGGATELHVFPGTCHGFDAFLPEWETSQQLYALQGAALRRVLINRHS